MDATGDDEGGGGGGASPPAAIPADSSSLFPVSAEVLAMLEHTFGTTLVCPHCERATIITPEHCSEELGCSALLRCFGEDAPPESSCLAGSQRSPVGYWSAVEGAGWTPITKPCGGTEGGGGRCGEGREDGIFEVDTSLVDSPLVIELHLLREQSPWMLSQPLASGSLAILRWFAGQAVGYLAYTIPPEAEYVASLPPAYLKALPIPWHVPTLNSIFVLEGSRHQGHATALTTAFMTRAAAAASLDAAFWAASSPAPPAPSTTLFCVEYPVQPACVGVLKRLVSRERWGDVLIAPAFMPREALGEGLSRPKRSPACWSLEDA